MKKITTPDSIHMISSRLLAKEAIRRGIKVSHINFYRPDEAFLKLNYHGHEEILIGQRSSKTSFEAYWILENKDLARSYLRNNKISVAKGKVFKKKDYKGIYEYCRNIGYPVVVKKTDGAHGDLIFIGIKNEKDLQPALEKIFKSNNIVIIEKKFEGKEFRVLATQKKVVGVIHREPANVMGDGINNIGKLIEIKNRDPRRAREHYSFLTKIEIDKEVYKKLSEQGISVNYIPKKGEKIYLRNNSNLSTGGDSIDYTDIIHPGYKKIAVRAVQAIPGLAYAGIDLMAIDIQKKPSKNNYIIIEMNSSPSLRSHHSPYKGESRNASKEIINILFPETKDK